MKVLSALLLFASFSVAQNIVIKPLVLGSSIKISLSPDLTTTLLFPGRLSGTFGLGLVSSSNPQNGTVQVDHPDGSNILVLHALSETAHVLATVLLDGKLYVLDLVSGPQPDVAVTFVKSDGAAPRAEPVTPEQIIAARPTYAPELLIGLLRRARDSNILRPLYGSLYDGYSKRDAQYSSDSGTYKTTVTTIHRFSKEDAVVLQGVVENETDKPLTFDGRAATVLVASEVHPIKLLDCLRPIPAHTKTLIDVVIQGDIDGGRANLALENEYRIMLPGDTGNVWSFKNGGLPGKTVPSKPLNAVPLTQTGKPKKEAQ